MTTTQRHLLLASAALWLASCPARRLSAQAAFDVPPNGAAAIAHWTQVFTSTRRREYERALQRAQPWAAMIAAKPHAAQLPSALVYLPLIESSYSPWAESEAGAAGLWQLMPATARTLGLEVSAELDERRDPWKSTDAALRHLRDLHRASGDWLLALSAYNAGIGRVAQTVLRVPREAPGADHNTDRFWRIASWLPRETQQYVPQVLAAYQIGSAPEVYGIRLPTPQDVPALMRVSVPPRTPLALVAREWDMTVDAVRAWNPQLQGRETPNRWYALVLPATEASARQARIVAQVDPPQRPNP